MKLISSKKFLKHKRKGHVERPERIAELLKELDYEEAKNGELQLNICHTTQYINFVKEHIGILDAGDTYADKNTYKVACYAVGAAVQAAESAIEGENTFALVRPPGHHAHPGFAGGFCIFSNMAIAAGYVAGKGKKVLIIDIDMHRGDGTQECVKKLNKDLGGKIWYLSINQRGVFPGASLDEGKITNVYVPAGLSEKEYIAIMKKEVLDHVRRHKPDIIGVSAGFDCFEIDKENFGERLGCGLCNTVEVIYALKRLIKVPYFVVLEGGYSPEAVEQGVKAFLMKAPVRVTKPAKKKVTDKKSGKKKSVNKKSSEKKTKKKSVKKGRKHKTVKKNSSKKTKKK